VVCPCGCGRKVPLRERGVAKAFVVVDEGLKALGASEEQIKVAPGVDRHGFAEFMREGERLRQDLLDCTHKRGRPGAQLGPIVKAWPPAVEHLLTAAASSAPQARTTVPTWRPDPTGRYKLRLHSGTCWTDLVSTGRGQQVDPQGHS
jgi:hypothetical protein